MVITRFCFVLFSPRLAHFPGFSFWKHLKGKDIQLLKWKIKGYQRRDLACGVTCRKLRNDSVVRPRPASFCARHWDKCIVGTTLASEGGRRKGWLSLFWVQSVHVTSHLLPEMTPGEGLTIAISPRGWALRFWEYVCRPGWAVSLIAEESGMWTPPSHHRVGEMGSEAHLSVAPTPHYTCSSPSAHSEWLSALPLQHQTTKPSDPPILTASSTHPGKCASAPSL